MHKINKLGLYLMLLVIIGLGCSNNQEITNSSSDIVNIRSVMGTLDIPIGSTLESATLVMNVRTPSNNTIYVHRITSPWDEMGVTYNSFGGAYDPAVIGSFIADGVGERSVDVTSLVQAWIDGTYENYGFLLEQGQTVFTIYASSEAYSSSYHPKLEICYSTPSGTECVTIKRNVNGFVYDTYIWANIPDANNGAKTVLFSGLISGLEKQTLIMFDMENTPELASIGDYVWLDDNRDGIQDQNEVGYPDATVMLYDCAGQLIASTLTDANGYYLFDGLTPGDYNVVFVRPEGYAFSPQDMGTDDAVDSDADQSTGVAACTNLEAGEHDSTWDAGIFMPDWEGCSLTIGFWKTHAGFGPQADVVTPLLTIWLGTPGGAASIEVSDATIAHDVLVQKTYGKPSNGITKLYAQLLAVKLNAANGADTGVIDEAIATADEFLADHNWEAWNELSRKVKKGILKLKNKFDDYNNGDIGPGHCDDFGDDD